MAAPKILCALLAAGQATRFGGNKVEAMLGGAMLGTYAAQTLINAQVSDVIAITRSDTTAFNEWFAERGFALITNDNPSRGLSSSIALAASAAQAGNYDALMIVLGDMPYVPVDHLRALAGSFVQRSIVTLCGETRMPPAIFPASAFAALIALTGESGARDLLHDADTICTDSGDLFDIDTVDDLASANARGPRK
jgi:molybdenum cofactor cytidylyltransferase